MIVVSIPTNNQSLPNENINPYAYSSSSCDSVSNNINAAFTLLGIILILFSIGMIISGLVNANYMFIVIGISSVVVSAILLLIGVFVVVTISGDVCYN